ncbi:MAG: LysR family transcriptional regulator [Acidobacteria bacterium]|nr:LysR family transcriptional regulator [Acidobacteriota bacterium]
MPARYSLECVDLRRLNYFATVAELGSVTKAAAALHMTQPSLSRQIADLERELGYKLFTRSAQGAELTPAGAGLHIHLDGLFTQVAVIPEILRTASQRKELVRIGLPPGIPHPWFLAVLRESQERVPLADISLHEASSDEQRQMLRHGLLDLGLLHLDPPELQSIRVLSQKMGVAVTEDSVLARLPFVRFSDLAGLRVMAHASGEIASEESRLRSASASAGVTTDWIFRRFSQHSELIATSSKVDAALMTEASALRHLPGWTWIEVKESDAAGQHLSVETWAAWNTGARPHVRQLAQILQKTQKRVHKEGK